MILSWLLAAGSVALAIPTITLCVEIIAAFFRGKRYKSCSRGISRLAVLVPARNEREGITATLRSIKAQLRPDDVVLVVADNCTDDTAEVARVGGAAVVERHDTINVGKGYALDFGVRHLENIKPDVVIIIDADCLLSPGTLDDLASASLATGRPAQALYLMTAPLGSKINQQVAEFAWRVKNWIRPRGLYSLGLPCQLMGTGMAFPWKTIQEAYLANTSIVEDLKLGLDLARTGHAPLFCPSAQVTSEFASSTSGQDTQRRRWEQGHIATILQQAPALLGTAISNFNLNLLVLTLDLMVPPLSLLVMLLLLSLFGTACAAWFGLGFTAFAICATSCICFFSTLAVAWRTYGRAVLPGKSIALIPLYVLRKVGLYRQALLGKAGTRWIGTDRAKN